MYGQRTAGFGEPGPEALQPSRPNRRPLQHLARVAMALVPSAAAAHRELGKQLSRFEDEIVAKAMELGATRRLAVGLARHVTGTSREARTSLLLSGEIDRARADVDAVVGSLLAVRISRTAPGYRAGAYGAGDENRQVDAVGIPHLAWNDAYGCGEPAIDGQHHELFDLGNNLIDTSLVRRASPIRVEYALGSLLEHVTRHFADEEAWLAARCYRRLPGHRAAHASLLMRAAQLRAKIDLRSPNVGPLVRFLADDVVAKHMLAADRDYYPLVVQTRGTRGGPSSST
jgi:hemerythrin-like metal-binding protein